MFHLPAAKVRPLVSTHAIICTSMQVCAYCKRRIEDCEYVFGCMQCKTFVLCPDCAVVGPNFRNHRSSHKLFIANPNWLTGKIEQLSSNTDAVSANTDQAMFSYRINDDLKLLTLIDNIGLGSWERIQKQMHRPADEPPEVPCKRFFNIFLDNSYMLFNKNAGNARD